MVVTQACIIMGVGLCEGFGEGGGANRRWHLDSPLPTLALLIGITRHVCICILIDMVSCFNHSNFTMLLFIYILGVSSTISELKVSGAGFEAVLVTERSE